MVRKPQGLQFSICVSGSHAGPIVEKDAVFAKQLGTSIAKRGHILTTGATVGLPYYAAQGAKEAGGISIGFSPAASLREHLRKYRLPYHVFDFINFTGLQYVGRDLYLVQSSDAVISIGGSFGSLHEFTSALEAGKPCGVLVGSGGTADLIPALMKILEPPRDNLVVYSDDPEDLVDRVIKILDHDLVDVRKQVDRDEHWFLDQPPKKSQG